MNYPDWLIKHLINPETKNPIQLNGHTFFDTETKQEFPLINDILSLNYPRDLSGSDLKMNRIYQLLAPLYDINEQIMGKLALNVDIRKGRAEVIQHLGLKPGIRVLEVSPGPGVYQPYLRQAVGPKGEMVALDLSLQMLSAGKKTSHENHVHLIHGNAQHLPFQDNSFDALFHFGGINLFNDPQLALNEFIRVTKPGGLVSWGDEGFAENYQDEVRRKILSKMNPGFLLAPPTPPDSVEQYRKIPVFGGVAYLAMAIKK